MTAQAIQEIAVVPIFSCLLVPAGHACAALLNPAGFRARSRTEQLLWSISLSAPFCLVLANIFGRYAGQNAVLAVLLSLDVLGMTIFLRAAHVPANEFCWDRHTRWVCAFIAAAVFYLCAASLPVDWHGHLYEPVCSSDWEIRLPLIRAAIQDGVPPHNPFFTLHGQSPVMRYYYYWYSLCALPGRMLHVTARSLLVASSVYALLVMSATLFLVERHMLVSSVAVRRRCLLLLGLCVVLGLDVLPSLLGLAVWRVRLQPDIEWWIADRSPGLPSALLFGPHHVAGIACGLLALVTLTIKNPEAESDWMRRGLVVALCFAGLVGTSSFVTLFFAAACTLLFADQLMRRERQIPAALVLAALLSVSVSLPFLHELTARTVATRGTVSGRHALKLQVRGDVQGQLDLYIALSRMHLPHPAGLFRFVPRLLMVALHFANELGFFAFVFAITARRDWRRRHTLQVAERTLWMLTSATAVFFLFVSSTPIQLSNDLGIHAGLVLRILGVLWGARIVPEFLDQKRLSRSRADNPWLFRAALTCLILGLLMTIWQAIVDRTYLILLAHQEVPAALPFPAGSGLGEFYWSMHEAQAEVAQKLPNTAVVQGNPLSRHGLIFRLYQQHRQAAGDASCEGSFGGDPKVCDAFLPDILQLFGVHTALEDRLVTMTSPIGAKLLPGMNKVCSDIGLDAVMATRFDPVWYEPQSWVWHGRVLYADRNIRVVSCSAAS